VLTIRIVTITGPSGSGKTTILKLLLESGNPKILPVVSTTTRPPRESDAVGEYEHVDSATFDALKKGGAFLWDVSVADHRYGTRKKSVDEKVASGALGGMILVPSIVPVLRTHVSVMCAFTLSVYIEGVPEEVLRERMQRRGDSEESIAQRLAECQAWDAEAQGMRCFNMFVSNKDEVVPGRTAAYAILNYLQRHDFD